MEFVGFVSTTRTREYTFTVREPATEPRRFTLTIANEAFDDHRIRYQDAPDLCSLRLRRELASHANHPPETHFDITDVDFDDYRSTHARTVRSVFSRKPVEDY